MEIAFYASGATSDTHTFTSITKGAVWFDSAELAPVAASRADSKHARTGTIQSSTQAALEVFYSRKSVSSEMCCTSSSRAKLACNPHCPQGGKSSSLRIHNSEGLVHPLCSGRQIPESGTVSPLRKATCWALLPVLCCVTFTSPLQNEMFIFTRGNKCKSAATDGELKRRTIAASEQQRLVIFSSEKRHFQHQAPRLPDISSICSQA
jgi:hypothetical protein